MISALRQYSGFDYSVTFIAFLFFALPTFWVGQFLKLNAGGGVQRLPAGSDHHTAVDDPALLLVAFIWARVPWAAS